MGHEPPNSTNSLSPVRRWWDRVVVQPLREANEESRAYLASPAAQGADRKVLVVLISTAVIVTVQRYLGGTEGSSAFPALLRSIGLSGLADYFIDSLHDATNGELNHLLFWATFRVIGSLFVPVAIIWFVFGERVRDYGTKLRGASKGLPFYLGMLSIMIPAVVLVSRQPAFQNTYPYYRLAPHEPLWPRFWIGEVAYLFQFFVLEFFFRGYMIHGLRHRFGAYSIVIMSVPYCMVHFGKPMPETLGSIVAGLVLGFMSLKTRSIWLGTALHLSVAITMDTLALYHRGRLF